MTCYAKWVSKDGKSGYRPLRCGQCHGCRLEYARQWAIRCVHEASMHDENCFVTLTYAKDCFNLVYTDFQLFMKRLRARFFRARIRFYMCGEYGELNGRAHFHALLFGFDFPDKVYFKKSDSGEKLYRSKILEELWPLGHSLIGSVTFESAGYVARYVMKKNNDGAQVVRIIDPDTGAVFERCKEFARMSLRPGIGASWIRKFRKDVYPHGRVVSNGVEVLPPKYYDELYRRMNAGGYKMMKGRRHIETMLGLYDNVPGRVEAKEEVSKAALRFLRRDI